MEDKIFKLLFEKSNTPTLYVVSDRIELANRAAAKLFGQLGETDIVGSNFRKVWPKRTKAVKKGAITALKNVKPGKYELTVPDGKVLNVETVSLSRRPVMRRAVFINDVTESIRSEKALRENEQRYRVMAETALAGIWITDPDENIIFVNPALAGILGYPRDELVGTNIARLTDKDGFAKYREGTQLRKKGVRNQYESTLKSQDGKLINVLVSASPLTGVDGKYEATLGFVADITERKRAEEALRESEERFKNIAENAVEWIWEVGVNGRYTYASPVVEQILGYKPEEVIGKHFYDFFHPEDRKELKKAAFEVFGRKQPFREFLNRNVHKSGKTVWLSTSGVPILDENGDLLGYRGADTDVTTSKITEDELKASQEYTRNIIDSSPDMIVSVDNERRIVKFNDAAEETFGYSREEVIGKHVDILYADLAEGRSVSEDIEAAGKFSGEVLNIRKNGEIFPSYLSASLLRNADGDVVGVMGVSRDITTEKKTMEALRESQQRFATLVEAALEGICIVDSEENIIYTNAAFPETLGYTIEEIIGMNVSSLVPAEQFETIMAETERRKRGEKSTYEVEFLHRDGTPKYFVISAAPMFGRDGVYEGAYAVFLDITERKKTEEEKEKLHAEVVAAMKERQALFDGVDVLLWALRERDDGRLYYEQANAAFAAVEGRKPKYYIGKPVDELHTPEECERIWNSYEWAKFGKLRSYEAQFGSEPNIRYFAVRIIPLPEPDGSIRSFLASGMDITERRAAEGAVRESEERYRAFTEEAIVGVYIYRASRFFFVNKEMESITGYTKDELLTINTDELVDPEDRKYLAEREKARKKGDELPARYTMRIKRKNGESAVMMVGSRPIQYGGETAYLGNCVDITENVKAQEAVESEKEKAQRYLDIAGVMLVVFGTDCKVRMINKKGCKLLGYTEDEIIGKNWFYNFVPRKMRTDIKSRFEKLMSGEKEPEEHFENPVLTKDGEERIVLWHTTVLKDENGDIVGALSSGEDVTERKLAEKALEREHFAFKIIAEAAVNAADVNDLCRRVITGLVETLAFDAGTFRLSDYDEGEQILRLVASFGLRGKEKELSGVPQPINDSRYVAAFVARSRKPIIAPDVSKKALLKPFKTRLIKFKEQSLISWPVMSAAGDVLGVLHLWSRKHVDISEGDRAFFERVAGMFASVLERKRTEEALRESEERIRQFAETVPDLLYKWNHRECDYDFLSPAFERITGYSLEEIYADPCDFQEKMIHPDETIRIMKIVNEYATGGPKEEPLVVETRMIRADGEVIWVRDSMVYEWDDEGLSKVIGVMSDITERKHAEEALRESEERFRRFTDTVTDMIYRFDVGRGEYDFISPSCEVITGYTVDEFNAAPTNLWDSLIHPEDVGRVKSERNDQFAVGGTGNFYNLEYRIVRKDGEAVWVNEQGNFEVDEKGNITNFNGVVRNITDRKSAEAILKDTLTKLRESLYGTVSTISKIVETRDPYTSGHQTRVAKLARSIAVKMGLAEMQVELIYMAALVHDIGKISVPQEILSKPTKLTDLEWNIIKTHPEVGCEILKNVEFPWPVIDVVLQHHERLNGSGYPQGLEGDEIMLEARILSLADVVEAMSSHRPYRPELGIDKALAEITGNKGVLYDEDVVDACIELFETNGFELGRNL